MVTDGCCCIQLIIIDTQLAGAAGNTAAGNGELISQSTIDDLVAVTE